VVAEPVDVVAHICVVYGHVLYNYTSKHLKRAEIRVHHSITVLFFHHDREVVGLTGSVPIDWTESYGVCCIIKR